MQKQTEPWKQRYEFALLCCNPVSTGNTLSLTSPPFTPNQEHVLHPAQLINDPCWDNPLLSEPYLIFNQHGKSMLVYAELISLDIHSLSSEKNNKMSKTQWWLPHCGNRCACPSINVVQSAPLCSLSCMVDQIQIILHLESRKWQRSCLYAAPISINTIC